MNPGKRFENDFKASIGRSVIRLYDTTTGYAGIKNACDFIYHTSPFMNLLELKSVQGKRLDYANISDNQQEQLAYYLTEIDVNPVILVEFREVKRVFIIPFDIICEHLISDKKSINVDECIADERIREVDVQYRRTHCRISEASLYVELQNVGLYLRRRLLDE